MASTGTSVPAKILVNSGVIAMAPMVDAVVMSTDSATSPLAMYVATLEDWCETKLNQEDSRGEKREIEKQQHENHFENAAPPLPRENRSFTCWQAYFTDSPSVVEWVRAI